MSNQAKLRNMSLLIKQQKVNKVNVRTPRVTRKAYNPFGSPT